VNTDYLAVRRLTQDRQQKAFKRTISVGEFSSATKIERTLDKLKLKNGETYERGSQMYKIYKEKKEKMNLCVKFYLKLRTNVKVIFVKKQAELIKMYQNLKLGDVKVKSVIEQAIIDDIKQQVKTGKPTEENYKKQTQPCMLALRFI
jgi:hypothetical protein